MLRPFLCRAICASRIQTDNPSRPPFERGGGEETPPNREFLSGGVQLRVAGARALAHSPRLVFADEPTGNIDPELSLEMMELLERVSEMGITVLVVTHEHELVRRFNRRTVTLKNGRIISDVPASFGEEVHA